MQKNYINFTSYICSSFITEKVFVKLFSLYKIIL